MSTIERQSTRHRLSKVRLPPRQAAWRGKVLTPRRDHDREASREGEFQAHHYHEPQIAYIYI